MHYYRVQTHGDVGIGAALVRQHRADERCEVEGCERHARTKGRCKAHYNQELLSGVPASVFGTCLTCAEPVDLRTPSGRLRKPNVLCEACRLKISNGRWVMTTTELAERDGLRCSICIDPIDMSLKFPNLFSASVDHVLPRARGGKDLPDNVALAHLICNMRKGARPT
jgi:5-methylcytosine-specific restriction endonuclease McrA